MRPPVIGAISVKMQEWSNALSAKRTADTIEGILTVDCIVQ
jgi:hypothetical protein